MEWITHITAAMLKLPWPAAVMVILALWAAREGVPALLKLLGFGFEREKYKDAQKAKEHDALVDELKDRIEKLEELLASIQHDQREERVASAKALASEVAAHAQCQIQQEALKGDLRVQAERIKTLEVKIEVLERHDRAGKEHLESLSEALKQVESESR